MTTQFLQTPITIKRAEKSAIRNVDFDNLVFGKNFADHMLVAEYRDGAWQEVVIKPFGKLELSPATSVLHYGQAIFEGMKANRTIDGGIALFRPEKNWERFNRSAVRMSMPEVPKEIFIEGLLELIRLDREWVPNKIGYSLYIRPFMIATEPTIGVKTSSSYLFCIITSPVGAYYSDAIKVLVSDEYIRAAEGGVGFAKTAGNYARTLYPVEQARKQGYRDILWLDGRERKYVEEVGTMNIFFVLNGKICTPKVDGTILEGVTRDSVLKIAGDLDIPAEERKISIDELVLAHQSGKLTEIFGSGTAAIITPVSGFSYKGIEYNLDPSGYTVSARLKAELQRIKENSIPDRHNWLVRVS